MLNEATSRNNASPDLYNLKVTFDSLDVYECNNSFIKATPIQLDQDIKANIRTSGDIDYYSFQIPKSGVITANVTNVAGNLAMRMYMYSESDLTNPINSISTGDGQNASLEKLVCSAGKYYVVLYEATSRNNSNPDLYNLKVSLDTLDRYECNNEFNTAKTIKLCDTIIAYIRGIDDVDNFQFNSVFAGNVKVRLLEVPSTIDMEMHVYNSSQTQVGSTIFANVGQITSTDIALPTSGNYYISLNDRNKNASSASRYRLLLEKGCVTGTNEISNIDFEVSPNPAKNQVTIKLGNTEGYLQKIQVSDLTGRTLIQKEVKENQINLDISTLPNGLYILKVETKEGKEGIKKFVKE